MTTHKHTPGPWKIQELGTRPGYPDWHQYAIRDKYTNVHIATVGNVDRYYENNTKEHARLIAAAPDLLAACELFVSLWPVLPGNDKPKATPEVIRAWNIARTAIAKATEG